MRFWAAAAACAAWGQASRPASLGLPDCTHDPCHSTKYDEEAPSPLSCPSGIGGLPGSFFEGLGPWQKRYGRDNLELSERFLREYFRPRLLPEIEACLEACPAALLEVMMNGVLALETREGPAAAREFLLEIWRLRDRALAAGGPGARQVRQLLVEWNADIAHVYPKLLDLERLGPDAALPEAARVGDPRTRGGAVEDWCLGQRFFVYELPEPKVPAPGSFYCLQGQWGTEVLMYHYLRHNCNTLEPEEADWFYVPLYATCRYVRLSANASGEALADLDELSNAHIWHPLLAFLRESWHFHRNRGRDHVFLFADGQGPRIWDSFDFLRSESVFLSPEASCPTWGEPVRRHLDVKPCLSSWKDIVIPGHTDYARVQFMKRHSRPTGERRLLATFHGRAPGLHEDYADCEVRGQLMKLGQQHAARGVDVGGFVGDYPERKGDSLFCLVPAGTSPWTNHLYESFYSGCVPVILSDEYVVAFQEELPWDTFSLHVPESEVCGDAACRSSPLLARLEALAAEPGRLARMKQELERHSCFFNWYSTDEACSPFLLVQRRLAGLRQQRARKGRFWPEPKGVAPHLQRRTRFKGQGNETFAWLEG